MLKARIENNIVHSPYPKLGVPVCSVYTVVKSFLGVAGSKLAVVDYTTSYTRQELLHALQRYAAGFQSHGLKLGDHVCVHLRNSVDSFVTVFGLIFAGATIILAKTSLTHQGPRWRHSTRGRGEHHKAQMAGLLQLTEEVRSLRDIQQQCLEQERRSQGTNQHLLQLLLAALAHGTSQAPHPFQAPD
ncbi:hypothetical protein HPB49_004462 [Dermacentor silvarum]|uniref:Uncharacterized protein n=1 Tax=Dermacentor silvarum TaxID=543639 RepID=A0ACB8C788_DERSI|nr:hypothetical protein HPB49_004462 [Dermacentor silvarum]